MTVRELIDTLSELPLDLEVYVDLDERRGVTDAIAERGAGPLTTADLGPREGVLLVVEDKPGD
jgi:hypothetical protein